MKSRSIAGLGIMVSGITLILLVQNALTALFTSLALIGGGTLVWQKEEVHEQ